MNNSFIRNMLVGTLALGVVMSASSFTPPRVYADGTSDLQAQIQALLEQITKLQAQIGSKDVKDLKCSVTWVRDLKLGSTGADVYELQKFLNKDSTTRVASVGAGSPGLETHYFGSMTQTAVSKFQQKHASSILTPLGLVNGTGYFGASSRAKANVLCAETPSPVTPTPETPEKPAKDSEGDLSVARGQERTNSIDLGKTEAIYSVDLRANGSDMTIERVDVIFDKRPWLYLDEVSLVYGGKVVATLSGKESNFSKTSNEWRARFSNLSIKVEEGEREELIVEAEALDSLSRSREQDTISVYIPRSGIRSIDTLKITQSEPGSDLAPRSFNFVESSGSLSVKGLSEIKSRVIQVSNNSTTKNASVLGFSFEAEGGDATLEDIYVRVTATNEDPANSIREVRLKKGSKVIARENVTQNGATALKSTDEDGNDYTLIDANEHYVHFGDIEVSLSDGDIEEFTLEADFEQADGSSSRYASGETVTFELREVTGEDDRNNDIVAGDMTIGSDVVFTLLTDGIQTTFKSEDASTTGTDSLNGDYSLTFDVTAFGEDIYIPQSADRRTSTAVLGTVGVEYIIAGSGGSLYADGSSSALISSTATKSNGYYKVPKGSTRSFTLRVNLDNRAAEGGVSGFYRVELGLIRYLAESTSGVESVVTDGLSEHVTDSVYVRN